MSSTFLQTTFEGPYTGGFPFRFVFAFQFFTPKSRYFAEKLSWSHCCFGLELRFRLHSAKHWIIHFHWLAFAVTLFFIQICVGIPYPFWHIETTLRFDNFYSNWYFPIKFDEKYFYFYGRRNFHLLCFYFCFVVLFVLFIFSSIALSLGFSVNVWGFSLFAWLLNTFYYCCNF